MFLDYFDVLILKNFKTKKFLILCISKQKHFKPLSLPQSQTDHYTALLTKRKHFEPPSLPQFQTGHYAAHLTNATGVFKKFKLIF